MPTLPHEESPPKVEDVKDDEVVEDEDEDEDESEEDDDNE